MRACIMCVYACARATHTYTHIYTQTGCVTGGLELLRKCDLVKRKTVSLSTKDHLVCARVRRCMHVHVCGACACARVHVPRACVRALRLRARARVEVYIVLKPEADRVTSGHEGPASWRADWLGVIASNL